MDELMRVATVLVDGGIEFYVVGGHAVSALATPRFSNDFDIVIERGAVDDIEEILTAEGFIKSIERRDLDEIYGGEFIQYVKDLGGYPIKVDLLVNGLVCRDTGASWGFEYIKKNSQSAILVGSAAVSVAKRELVIALKLHSARKPDIRDVVILVEDADIPTTAAHIPRGNQEALEKQLDKFESALDDPRLLDSLKGVFRFGEGAKEQIDEAREFFLNLREYLYSEKS